MSANALFISDQKYLSAQIQGGVQLCTQEYLKYITLAGYSIQEFAVQPDISLLKRVKIRAGIDAYEHYAIDKYLSPLIHTINSGDIKLVFFNQLNLAVWAKKLKKHVASDVKFIGLSHGNESADYLHNIIRQGPASKLQTWKLGKLLIEEAKLFSSALNGIIVLNENEVAVNNWLGANHILYLPRLLAANFINRAPVDLQAGFVGTLDHLPNKLGIEQLAKELKAQNYQHQLKLVGGPAKTGENLANQYNFITYMGPLSDAELVDEVKTWSVFLNPVFWYARGASTKLALAINWGIPVLTTPSGRRGYALTDETIVTDDNTPYSIARKLIVTLNEPALLQELKKATERNALNFDISPWLAQLKTFLQ